MPTVPFNLTDKSGKVRTTEIRQAHLDTGCNVNLISRKAFQRDGHLLGPDMAVHNIKPFTVQLADGKSESVTLQVAQNACLAIGKAFYPLSFLIVENLTVDYLIGFPFLFMYDAQIKPARAKISLGVPQSNLINKQEGFDRLYQTVDIKFHTKKLTLITV
jgi:hypothetical protein